MTNQLNVIEILNLISILLYRRERTSRNDQQPGADDASLELV